MIELSNSIMEKIDQKIKPMTSENKDLKRKEAK